jgi:hypothetical protein
MHVALSGVMVRPLRPLLRLRAEELELTEEELELTEEETDEELELTEELLELLLSASTSIGTSRLPERTSERRRENRIEYWGRKPNNSTNAKGLCMSFSLALDHLDIAECRLYGNSQGIRYLSFPCGELALPSDCNVLVVAGNHIHLRFEQTQHAQISIICCGLRRDKGDTELGDKLVIAVKELRVVGIHSH